MLLLISAFGDNPFSSGIGVLYFYATQTSFMNHRTLIATTCLLALFAILFSSCSIEKRHYRNGYYIQRATGIFNQHANPYMSSHAQKNLTISHDRQNSESTTNVCLVSKTNTLKNKNGDSSSAAYSANEVSEQPTAAQREKIRSTNSEINSYQRILNDEPNEKKKDKSGTKMIFWGLVLLPLWPMTIFAIVLLILGTVRRHKIAKKNPKSVETVNTKPLWVLSLILFVIAVTSIMLFSTYELFAVIALITLPLALIYVIGASVMDRRNKKLNPEANNKDKNKKALRILKSILLWITVLVTLGIFALLAALLASY